MTQAAQLAQYGANNVGLSFKNRIINGDFGIWQRGTSLTTSSNAIYGYADRFLTNVGASTTYSRSTDVPSGFQYSVSCAGSAFNGINQRIESVNCYDLAGQQITVSFWAKRSSGTGALSINLAFANSVDNFSSTTTIGGDIVVSASPSASWTRYSYTYSALPSGAANGLQIVIFNGSAGSDTTLYTGVQLEKGSVATSFDYLPFGTELMLCQRYFERSGTGGSQTIALAAGSRIPAYFAVSKRAAPTVTYTFVAGDNVVTLDVPTTSGFRINTSGSVGAPCDFTWTAAIEL